jgi:glutamate 5-kinase
MRRLIIKIGTSVIAPGGRLDPSRLRALVDQLDLARDEHVIVTSGAIACGTSVFEADATPSQVIRMQAAAAVGQSQLMHTYERLFFGKKVVAQLLLSSDDFNSSIRYRNLCNTLEELLRLKVLPIVNENDSVSVRELEGAFGDNDELSALLAQAIKADWLILLTDVDGFYRRTGHKGESKLVRRISRITSRMEAECNGKGKLGRGGMKSKLRAACIATAAGTQVAIANGTYPNVIPLVLKHRVGSHCAPQSTKGGLGETKSQRDEFLGPLESHLCRQHVELMAGPVNRTELLLNDHRQEKITGDPHGKDLVGCSVKTS